MHRLFKHLVMAFALCTSLGAHAEDIDLFAGSAPVITDMPNVLIVLDNTANWNSAFVNEKAALVSVFAGLPVDKFRVGLMMFTETGGGNSGNDGGYIRAAIRPMNTANKAKYAAMIGGFDILGDKSNGGKVSKAMEEAFLYLSAGTPHAGNQKNKTDYAGNTSGSVLDNAVYALAGNALATKSGTTYNNPQLSGSCVRNYIIYISNGPAQDNNSDVTQATNALSAAGGSTTTLPINPSGSQDNVADEWARFLKKSALATTVYTVDINKGTTGQGPGWTALLKSMAAVTTGKYFDIASEGTQIIDTLNEVFSEIQAVNSVFASVSLPLSVNTQGTYLNQVFVGMFRPDADAAPRWAGNLKQYKIGRVNNVLDLLDADNASAINSQTGFITECARSFWTPTIVDTEWTFRPQGGCLRVADSQVSNYPDGNIVEKGAQAYRLRMTSTRTTKTCSAASCSALQNFDSTSVTQAALGAASTTERDALLNWAVGKDVDDEDIDTVTTADRRLSAHGDVVHSRPVALNLGTDAAPQVVVFYGGNDGWLRAINGNRTAAIGTIPAGNELWAFMPPEFHGKIKRIRDNSVGVSYPYTPPGGQPKPYGMDGPITSFQGLVSGVSKAFVYGTMRRGGRSIYAFDATNSLTTPTAPALKWRVGCPNAADDTNCTTGFTGIGQTWSSLKAMTASNYGSGAKSMQIFGGGYDACEDFDALIAGGANNVCTLLSKGHYVYVIDSDTGALVRAFDTGGTRGIVADATIVRDTAGQALYAYTADMGGNVYRISFSGLTPADWTMTKIASLGCDTTASCVANRKFMFAPSVVAVDGGYAVLLGSGDREKPLRYFAATTAVTNNFFMFIDKPTVAASTYPGNADCGANLVCRSSLLEIPDGATPSASALAAKKGWYLRLASTEQVVTSAVTIFGTVSFSTQQPAIPVAGACTSNLGTTLVYNVNYENAASGNGSDVRYEDLAGDGLPPPPVAGRVTLDNGETVPFCIGCSKDSPLRPTDPHPQTNDSPPKRRIFWYIQK